MEHFNKKLSDLFNQTDGSASDLPDEFSWENMEEGIHEKMEESKDSDNGIASRLFRFRKQLMLLLLLLALGIGVKLLLDQFSSRNQTVSEAKTKEISSQKKNVNSNSEIEKIENVQAIKSDVESKSESQKTTESSTAEKSIELYKSSELNKRSTIDSKKITKKKTSVLNQKPDSKIVKPRADQSLIKTIINDRRITKESDYKNPILLQEIKSPASFETTLSQPSFYQPIVNESSPVVIDNTKRALNTLDNISSAKVKAEEHTQNSSEEQIEEFNMKPLLKSSLNSPAKSSVDATINLTKERRETMAILDIQPIKFAISSKNQILRPYTKNEISVKPRKSISFSAGTTYFTNSFSGTTPERDSFDKSMLSQYGQLDLIIPISKRLFIQTGLQYEKLESKFEWEGNVLQEYDLENVVIGVVNNVISGESTLIYGDTTVTVNSRRNILNYNQRTHINVPLAFGATFSKGKFGINLSIGPELSVYQDSRGKTLQSEIIEYEGKDNAIYNSKLKITGIAQTRIHYKLKDSWSLFSDIRYKKHLVDWTKETNSEMLPQVLNGGIGFSYTLKK